MALHSFSWSPLRTLGSTFNSVSTRRWNSTTASNAAPNAERTLNRGYTSSKRRILNRKRFIENSKDASESRPLEKFMTREWRAGDVHAPHDLSPAEMSKWRNSVGPSTDIFDALKLNPLHMYKNFTIMSEFMSNMGRIKHSRETGLRPVNQRKMAKAIRRAIGLGLMPSVHRHPEILAARAMARSGRGSVF
ncbi:mitochondrial 37S ribosomal protein bS18m [Aspergillus homomorphus CBS 101889]|uniref:Small ribosomal subunit protein bS18m n=1 Tax=Aspergillus homomorphus (strain CBS 101889) TaxID=1450537 RepID=A0A395HIW3_ASPHC|nr:putative 37S ribosomal protein S18 [Aspergillus homomorphus CBS 101889]RAL07576.1 putative 37S ribosomal protein S18 [Aspergillus homomorphus CBS 101889]